MRKAWTRYVRAKVLSFVGYLLYEVGGLLALVAPVSFSYFIAVVLADLHFFLNSRSRNAVVANLQHVLGASVGEAELRRIARRSFRNFARLIVDFLRFPKLSVESIASSVDLEMLEVVREEFRKGEGVIFLAAHLGNWELGGAILSMSGFPLSVVAMPHENGLIDRFFVRRRTAKGIAVVSAERATSELLESLRRKECVAILADRNVLGRGLEARFFGSAAPMPYGHVILSLRTGAPIVPGFLIREAGGRFKAYVDEPIRPGTGEGAFEEIMGRCVNVMEKYVRRYPDQWFVFEPIWRES
ncbi:MAG: lysophospholipid acyltransferase family protein [Candidatus Eiseniibacteriota bacterium]|nr:MAG: lysophospholipid acyltransferase family protein [Candidatus Eisenbacteria bacterium]